MDGSRSRKGPAGESSVVLQAAAAAEKSDLVHAETRDTTLEDSSVVDRAASR